MLHIIPGMRFSKHVYPSREAGTQGVWNMPLPNTSLDGFVSNRKTLCYSRQTPSLPAQPPPIYILVPIFVLVVFRRDPQIIKTNANFKAFLTNPTITRSEKVTLLDNAFDPGSKTSSVTKNLLVTMAGNARLGDAEKVSSSFACGHCPARMVQC